VFCFLYIIDEAAQDEIAMKLIELLNNAANEENVEEADDKDGDVHGAKIYGGGIAFCFEFVFMGTRDISNRKFNCFHLISHDEKLSIIRTIKCHCLN